MQSYGIIMHYARYFTMFFSMILQIAQDSIRFVRFADDIVQSNQ